MLAHLFSRLCSLSWVLLKVHLIPDLNHCVQQYCCQPTLFLSLPYAIDDSAAQGLNTGWAFCSDPELLLSFSMEMLIVAHASGSQSEIVNKNLKTQTDGKLITLLAKLWSGWALLECGQP